MTKDKLILRIPSQISNTVNVKQFMPIIDHDHFQLLDGKKQTGLLYLVFRGAKHTRFEHSVGTYDIATYYAQKLGLSAEETRTVQAFALLHDIAHIAYSHNVEPLLTINHENYGPHLIKDMAEAIASCDVDPEVIKRMLTRTGKTPRENALAQLVIHKVIGADKQDWMFRDCLHIGRKERPDTDRIAEYLRLENDEVMNDIGNAEELISTQHLYYNLHMIFYYNSQYLASQRVLQRAVQEAIDTHVFEETDLYTMTDGDLDAKLKGSSNPLITSMAQRLRTRTDPYKSVVTFKIDEYTQQERIAGKSKQLLGISQEEAEKFLDNYGHPRKLTDLETRLNAELGLKDGSVLITSILDLHRLTKPNEVLLWDEGNGHLFNQGGGATSLFKYSPTLEKDLMGRAYGKFSIMIMAPESQRETISRRAPLIEDYVRTAIASV